MGSARDSKRKSKGKGIVRASAIADITCQKFSDARTMAERVESGADGDGADASSPAAAASFNSLFEDALSPSGTNRNARLGAMTPNGSQLSKESSDWLNRHQQAAQQKFGRQEKKRSRLVKLRRLPQSDGGDMAAAASTAPLQLSTGTDGQCTRVPEESCLASAANRAAAAAAPGIAGCPSASAACAEASHAERGVGACEPKPQVLLLEAEGLIGETYRPSLWAAATLSVVRPGAVRALQQLSRRFLLIAFSRSPPEIAQQLISTLRDRGVVFDAAFCIPQQPHGSATPTLLPEDFARVCRAVCIPPAEMPRRALLVATLELEHDEIEARGDSAMLGHSGERRPPLRVALPFAVSLLVPHPRLQTHQSAVIFTELARIINEICDAEPTDWISAFEALPEHRALKKLRLAPPSSMLLPRETDDAALAAQLAADLAAKCDLNARCVNGELAGVGSSGIAMPERQRERTGGDPAPWTDGADADVEPEMDDEEDVQFDELDHSAIALGMYNEMVALYQRSSRWRFLVVCGGRFADNLLSPYGQLPPPDASAPASDCDCGGSVRFGCFHSQSGSPIASSSFVSSTVGAGQREGQLEGSQRGKSGYSSGLGFRG